MCLELLADGPPQGKESRGLLKNKGERAVRLLKRVSQCGKDTSSQLKAGTLDQFSQVTELPSRASLLNQSVLTDGSGISDLEAEGSICNPRVAHVPGGRLRSL